MSTRLVASASNVRYAYPDGTGVMEDFSFEVGEGEIVSLVGPSGCGKSTLLRILSGLLEPQAGEVRIAASDGSAAVTMVFQEDVLLPWLSVRKNIELWAKFSGKRGRDVNEWTDTLLEIMRLDGYADAHPSSLSGGMRRRVGVLQPLAARPTLLLLDEPFTSVDEPTRISILGDLRRLLRRLHTSAVLVTHDLAEAISLSDRIVVVSKRPLSPAQSFQVGLDEERDLFQVRQEPAFLSLYREAWDALRKQIQA